LYEGILLRTFENVFKFNRFRKLLCYSKQAKIVYFIGASLNLVILHDML
jgi:hypothetical protein